MTGHTWSVRVRTASLERIAVHAASGSFTLGPPLSFDGTPPPGAPTALDAFVGAFAADVLGRFRSAAERRRLALDEVELALTWQLGNPLVTLGVVGETGDPGIATISGTLYVSTAGSAEALEAAWAEALARSPLVATLGRAADLSLRLSLV